jgi:type II secretory pathway component PulF
MLVAPRSSEVERGTLTYLMIMFCVASAIIVFLMAYVVPQIGTIFAQQHADLPRATRLLIRFSSLVTDHWLMAAIPLVVLVAVIVGAFATPRGRAFYHYCDYRYSRQMNAVMEPVIAVTMAAAIVFMMLAVLTPIFQLNQLMH